MTHIMKFVRGACQLSTACSTFRKTTSYHQHCKLKLSSSFSSSSAATTCACQSHEFSHHHRRRQHRNYQHDSSNDEASPSNKSSSSSSVFFAATFAGFFGFFEKNEDEQRPEGEEEPPLITTLKRSVLLIQKSEFKKAEQMLHIALRQAQSLQNEDGITYVYDVMANLAFQVGEFDKAQKLFKSVMQRELAKGTPKDDLKIVHMSLKMAKILEHKGEYENAEVGYQYCMKILQEHIDRETDNKDVLTLWAMNLDWYAHLLLTLSRYEEAMKYMEKAYEYCVKINGDNHEQTVVLLNDLGSISFAKKNYEEAAAFLVQAVELGNKLPDMEDLSSIYTNLGNVYIKKGLLDEAKKSCSRGWRLSKDKKNYETMEEAKACLDEIKKLLIN